MNELSDDIATLLYDLSSDADKIKDLTAKLDEKIKKMYADIEVEIPPSDYETFDYEGWAVSVTAGLSALIGYPAAVYALERVAVSYLIREGEIGAVALVNLAGLPTWLNFGVKAGGIVAVVGLEAVISAVSGAIKRDDLQDAIKGCIQPRIDLKKAAIINNMVQEKLSAVIDSLDLMLQLGYTQDQLDQAQVLISDKFKAEVDTVTEETAKEDLAALDKNRGSWTNED